MYLAIDIGGTKTYVALINNDGVISQRIRFETPQSYPDFIEILEKNVVNIATDKLIACGVGAPGRINRETGTGLAMGNLPWKNAPLKSSIHKVVRCPVFVENDAKLGGLSEAMLVKDQYRSVLYITVSTGIGTGFVSNQKIDPTLSNSEAGKMPLEHHGKMLTWESFASGKSIVDKYHAFAKDIDDPKIWQEVANNLAAGMIDLIAITQPDVIILGGSVGQYFYKYEKPLLETLKQFATPLIPIPPIQMAKRPDDAVLYGCYYLARNAHEESNSKT